MKKENCFMIIRYFSGRSIVRKCASVYDAYKKGVSLHPELGDFKEDVDAPGIYMATGNGCHCVIC